MTLQIGDRVRVVLTRNQASDMRSHHIPIIAGYQLVGVVSDVEQDPDHGRMVSFMARSGPLLFGEVHFKEIYCKKIGDWE